MVRCNALYVMLVCEALLAVLFCYLYLDYKDIAERTQLEFDAYVSQTMVFEEYLNSIRFTNYTVSNDLIEEGACTFADRTLTCNDEESRRLRLASKKLFYFDYVLTGGHKCWGQAAMESNTFTTQRTTLWESIGLGYGGTTYEGDCPGGKRCEIETEVSSPGERNVKVTTYPRWHWWKSTPNNIRWEVLGRTAKVVSQDQGVICTSTAYIFSSKVMCKMNNSANTYSRATVKVSPYSSI